MVLPVLIDLVADLDGEPSVSFLLGLKPERLLEKPLCITYSPYFYNKRKNNTIKCILTKIVFLVNNKNDNNIKVFSLPLFYYF